MTRGVFVTGTDTGVGKTRVAEALLAGLAREGLRAAAMKPVASGCSGPRPQDHDAARLAAAAGVRVADLDLCPYAFAPAIAPHLAARQAGVDIDLEVIASAWQRLAAAADVVVVEAAGGVAVPLSDRTDMLDIAARLRLPVLLVVGIRLGCLNHALLSAQAIRARGLPLLGWVANRIDPAMACADDNVASLRRRLAAPLLADLPWNPGQEPRPILDLAAVLERCAA